MIEFVLVVVAVALCSGATVLTGMALLPGTPPENKDRNL